MERNGTQGTQETIQIGWRVPRYKNTAVRLLCASEQGILPPSPRRPGWPLALGLAVRHRHLENGSIQLHRGPLTGLNSSKCRLPVLVVNEGKLWMRGAFGWWDGDPLNVAVLGEYVLAPNRQQSSFQTQDSQGVIGRLTFGGSGPI